MGRADLVVASNRGPLSFSLDETGHAVSGESAGGLAAALSPLLEDAGATWVACAMSDADRKAAADGLMKVDGIDLVTVQPDPATYRMAYDVVSNSTLWFCHHHMFDLARRPCLDRHWAEAWDAYKALNQSFAEAVCEAAADGATVLVQDYHLCLLPRLVAAERGDLRCVHFTHTPFADPNILRILPETAERDLLEGMAAATACGFHTKRWEHAFTACCEDVGLTAPSTFVSPLTPDPDYMARQVSSQGCQRARRHLDELVGDRRVIVSVDRVELSKNLLRSFAAFDEMLANHPELREKVVMLAHAYLSRQGLAEYLAYGTEVEHSAARINDTWASGEWTPLILDVADDHDFSLAALTRYDVLLVNPIRDGLNLVAKEGPLVNSTDGVLALSREAGAFAELGDEALELNPFDITGTAEVLAKALAMPLEERRRRSEALRKLVTSRRPGDWLDDQLAESRTRAP